MPPPSLVPLVTQVLASPTAEPAMRRQVLLLAQQNLHQPGMAEALVASVPSLRDSEVRKAVIGLISGLDTSRFSDLPGFHSALLEALAREEERDFRAALIGRLAEGIGQDARIAPALVALLAKPGLDDTEAEAVIAAIGRLPQVDEATALGALAAVRTRDAQQQEWAIHLASRRPELTPAVAEALAGFLEPRIPAPLRLGVLRRLHQARIIPASARPTLERILREDPDVAARGEALDLLILLPRDPAIAALVAETAGRDADPALRARAAGLLSEASGTPADSARRLASEPDPAVRASLLAALRAHVRDPAVRLAVAHAFSAAPVPPDGDEAGLFLDLLAPYASREAPLREALFTACRAAPRPQQRARILAAVVPKVRIADVADQLADLFASESDPEVRSTLFAQLKPLSVARHLRLVAAWCGELVEPSSPFRLDCAGALLAGVEESAEIQSAFAEILLRDTDRALVRTCLDGYLKPRVQRQAEPLLAVIEAQDLETGSRQRALDAVVKLTLTEAEQQRLAGILAGPGATTLKRS